MSSAYKQKAMEEISDMLLSRLKSDVSFHQQKASAALSANLPEVCAEHLAKQAVAIADLVKLGETYTKQKQRK